MSTYNYQLVGCDTDSIKFCKSDMTPMTEDEMLEVLKSMNDATPSGIILEEDGYYEKFIVLKSKNYITQKKGKLEFKGSSLKTSTKEPILGKLLKEAINLLLEDREHELLDLYHMFCQDALQPHDIALWCKKYTITDKVLNPSGKAQEKVLSACEDAIEKGVIKNIQEGDKVHLYCALDGEVQKVVKGEPQFYKKTGEPIMVPNQVLKFADLFENDHDRWHQVQRVYDSMNILSTVIDIKKLPKYHLKSQRKKLLDKLGIS